MVGPPGPPFFIPATRRRWRGTEKRMIPRVSDQAQGPSKTSEGKAAEIERLIAPVLADMGYDIVRVLLSGGSGRQRLQIMAEKPDGAMSIDDCTEASRAISALLEVEDPISTAYTLEVSSPGIDRPLTRFKDFERYAGHLAKFELQVPFQGQKRFTGTLKGVEGDQIVLLLEGDEDEKEMRLTFDELSKAKLVLTDALLAEAAASQNED